MTSPAENTQDAARLANEIAAVDEFARAIDMAAALGGYMKARGVLSAKQVDTVLGALSDASSDLSYERQQIDGALQDWESIEAYGSTAPLNGGAA